MEHASIYKEKEDMLHHKVPLRTNPKKLISKEQSLILKLESSD